MPPVFSPHVAGDTMDPGVPQSWVLALAVPLASCVNLSMLPDLLVPQCAHL